MLPTISDGEKQDLQPIFRMAMHDESGYYGTTGDEMKIMITGRHWLGVRFGSGALALMSIAGSTLLAPPASAHGEPPGQTVLAPSERLLAPNPHAGPPGSRVTVIGSGVQPSARFVLLIGKLGSFRNFCILL